MQILNHRFLHLANKTSKVILGLSALFLTFSLASIFIQSCKKDKGSTSVKPANNLQKVNDVLQLYSDEYGKKKVTEVNPSLRDSKSDVSNFLISQPAWILSSINTSSTAEVKSFTDSENKEYHIFLTDYNATSSLSGGVVSVLLPEQRLLSYVSEIETISQNHVISHMYSLSGEQIGSIEFLNGSMINTTISTAPAFDPQTIEIRKWWKCTKECARETVQVCASDPHCYSMFVISNLPGGKVAGLGSMSIGAACGLMCIKDVKFDVLPLVAQGPKPITKPNFGPLKRLSGGGF